MAKAIASSNNFRTHAILFWAREVASGKVARSIWLRSACVVCILLAAVAGHAAPVAISANDFIAQVKLHYATVQSYAEDSSEFCFSGDTVNFSDQSQIRYERGKRMRFSAQKLQGGGSSINVELFGTTAKPTFARWDRDRHARYANLEAPTAVQTFPDPTWWSAFSLGDPFAPPQHFSAKLLFGEIPDVFDPARYRCTRENGTANSRTTQLLRCAPEQRMAATARVWVSTSSQLIEKIELISDGTACYYRFNQAKIATEGGNFASKFPPEAIRFLDWLAQFKINGISKEMKAAALAGDRARAEFVLMAMQSGNSRGIKESEAFPLIEKARALKLPDAQFLYSRLLRPKYRALMPVALQKLSDSALRSMRRKALMEAVMQCDDKAMGDLRSDDVDIKAQPGDPVDAVTATVFRQRVAICQTARTPAEWVNMERPKW